MFTFFRKSKFISLLIALITAAFMVSCEGKKKQEETPAAEAVEEELEQILLFGNGTEPETLDPNLATGVPESNIMRALLEGLVDEDPNDLHPIPGMAESWEISEDQKVYTFHIRKNAKWSNGDPFTAHDFVYSWKRILSPKLASEYSYMLHIIKNAKEYNDGKLKDFSKVGVKAVDDHTLEVTLKASTPYFLSLLTHNSAYPVHKATIEKFGKIDERGTKWAREVNYVGNGAFTLEKWELNKIIVVRKNPLYWDAATVKLEEIHFFPTDDQTTEERLFRSEKLHVTNSVPIEKIGVYQRDNPELIRIDPYLGTYYYRFNVRKKKFRDPRVRRALAMAIDRKTIVEKVTKGGQLPAFFFTPPNTQGYTSQHAIEYNVEKAKELLAQAGYPDGKGFPGCKILYNTHEAHKKIAEVIQQMWKTNLGVNVTLENQDWKVYLASQKSGDYDISRAGWIGDYPDPNTFLDMFVTDGGNNQTGWSNKKYDELIDKASMTSDQAKRYELFQEAEKILLDEVPVCPIYTYTRVYLISTDVKGWYPNIQDHHPYKHVYLKK
ncbi:MAG: peptide ABC transporter substrate-binding protein [Chitinispirillia bacterium]|jgi:oligopeptide transport system substrate-binding protein